MALMQTLQDPFVGANLNTQLWTQFTGGSATFSYGNGATVIYPASTTSSTDGDLTSVNAYNLTSSYAMMQVLAVPNNGGATTTDAQLRLGTAANHVDFLCESSTLFAQQVVASSQTNLTSTAYSPTNHAWWRIREQGGTTFWETSKDGITWSTFWSATNPITVTSLNVLIAGTAFSTAASPGNFTWRYFNIPISEGPYNHLRVSDGMSRSEVAN